MCEPTTLALMALGGGQAILGNKASADAANAANRNKLRIYYQQRGKVYGDHFTNINAFYMRGVDAERTWAENAQAANRGVQQEQFKINDKIDKLLEGTQTAYTQAFQDKKVALAAQRGFKRGTLAASVKVGRRKAQLQADLDKQINDVFKGNVSKIYSAKRAADKRADTLIGLAPIRGAGPQEPVWSKAPSAFQQLLNIGIGVGQGYLQGSSMAPQKSLDPGNFASGMNTDLGLGINYSSPYTQSAFTSSNAYSSSFTGNSFFDSGSLFSNYSGGFNTNYLGGGLPTGTTGLYSSNAAIYPYKYQ